MEVAIVTVGDEILAGDTENTNAWWLSRRLAERGATTTRILTLPDDEPAIADAVSRYHSALDRVIVTGGLGDTHDDVTMEAVAGALGRSPVVDADAERDVRETIASFRESNPELVERYPDMEIDVAAQASLPEGARYLPNPVGLAPGAAIEGVYVLPGIPEEMKAMFDSIADEFGGDLERATLHTPAPESALKRHVGEAREAFEVTIGSYPARGDRHNRIKVTGSDPETVREALEFLRERIDVVDPDESVRESDDESHEDDTRR
jgi:molybdenum cofactor synthesis domain-containing protein